MTVTRNDILFWTGIVTALWFAWTGVVWTYWATLVMAYPAGLVSLFIGAKIKSEKKWRTKYILIILAVGLLFSLSSLIKLLIFD